MGDGQGALDQDASAGNQQRGDGSDEQNNPDSAGEAEYEAVFAPRFSVEAAGDDELRLGADPGEAPLTEGEFQDNPFGASVVRSKVFSSYADAAAARSSRIIPIACATSSAIILVARPRSTTFGVTSRAEKDGNT